MGGDDLGTPVFREPTLKYHPEYALVLTLIPVNPGRGHFQLGSLTGAVSSKRVTEECKGRLRPVGNRSASVKVKVCSTASATARAELKGGLSDPVVACGSAIAQRIKGTPGITG